MNLRIDPLLALLALLCVGAVFMGGMVAVNVLPLPPGLAVALISALGGQDVPTFSHGLLGLLVGIGCVWLVSTRRVLQLPQTRILSPLLLFMALVGASVLISRFQGPSLVIAAEWILYGFAFLFAAGAMGRKQGPIVIAGTLFGSILYLATLGIREWKQSPEGWRIFALWTPNTQASVQIVGILLAIGLLLSRHRPTPEELRERAKTGLELGWLIPFFSILGLGLCGFALLLTGSKGGILALAAGVVFLAVALAAHRFSPKLLPWVGRLGLAAAAAACLLPGLVSKPPSLESLKQENKPEAVGSLSRLANASATASQSVGFRKLLWISSYRILKENPLGTGMGTFIYYSSQPGLTTQTQTAHNTLLHLLVEAGPLALIAFLAFLAFWMESVIRASSEEPANRARLRIAVVAAALALLFHAATESNLYSFGLGIIFFVLLAIASQLSADGVSPEFVPTPGKVIAGCVSAATVFLLLVKGWAEVNRGNMRMALQTSNQELATQTAQALVSLAPEDAETWYLQANMEPSLEARATDLRKAIDKGPIPRYYRALAQLQIKQNDLTGAQSTLRDCLHWDPNNLPARLLMLKTIDGTSHPEELEAAAQQLVDVEQTPYFQIRAIPEIVPTETLEGRKVLAELTKDPAAQVKLLTEACDGYREYLKLTVPSVVKAIKEDPSGALSPEPVDKCVNVLKTARECALRLAAVHKALGHSADATAAEAFAAEVEGALGNFDRK